MTINEIGHKLKKGDRSRIAEIVGCSISMVKAVFKEDRNTETELSQKIIKAGKLIVDQREELTNEFQKA